VLEDVLAGRADAAPAPLEAPVRAARWPGRIAWAALGALAAGGVLLAARAGLEPKPAREDFASFSLRRLTELPGPELQPSLSPDGRMHGDTGLAYLVEGRNKHHVTLNLEDVEGRLLLRRLAAKADVLIETARPGQMDAWGLGYRQLGQLNPRLVYVAISTYGQFGPRAASPNSASCARKRSRTWSTLKYSKAPELRNTKTPGSRWFSGLRTRSAK